MNNPSAESQGPDKLDMSLDEIIRLNKKEKQSQSHKAAALRKHRLAVRGRLNQGRRPGPPLQRGGGAGKLFVRKRRGQGVVTGLAARKTSLLKGVSPLNRPAISRPPRNRQPLTRQNQGRGNLNRPVFTQRTRPFIGQHRQTHTPNPMHTQRWSNTQKAPPHTSGRPFQLRRKWNAVQSPEAQREARQATFLSRRGLKVQTHIQKNAVAPSTQRAQRTRPWRTPQTNSGILTVSIDNPTARTQPEPAHSWSLHPPTPSQTSDPPTAPEPERKAPKGVALQFDINSVGKQTAMTLNERFRILKDKRVAAAKQSIKGGRFVTVG
ncbi:UAP56-interacting factor-like isoform X2 [Hoplias malabaricus]|uniref:UAP56-interacting factor-like isoform X2 n=1 Tax=Hoplias malabaricus TaxID=27720 RepID=UPI0034625191